jgi:hypothetical protein
VLQLKSFYAVSTIDIDSGKYGINQYFYSQIDTIITSTNPYTVYASYIPHMIDMGCNKAKIKINAALDARGFC